MTETKLTGKRIFAYFIDMVIVLIISSLFSNIEFLNPNLEKYEKAYKSYYKTVLKGENLNINSVELTDISYNMSKYGLSMNVISTVVTLLYFGIFQYYNKGQTIGKKLLKIKILSNKDKKIKLTQILGRSLIINSILASALTTLAIVVLSKQHYLIANTTIQLIDMIIVFISIAFILFREDGRGLHDILLSTTVVSEDVKKIVTENKDQIKKTKKTSEKGEK
ncbi:MAG: RDD family protein [Tenericutes bacterium]|nr:RDD family protein [Mycoplasmatota bacterium]